MDNTSSRAGQVAAQNGLKHEELRRDTGRGGRRELSSFGDSVLAG